MSSPQFDERSFDWLIPRIGLHAAFGVVNQVRFCGLPSDLPWMRDARDMAALLGFQGVGKEHNRRIAKDLLAEPGITPDAHAELAALLRRFDGKQVGPGPLRRRR